MTTQSTYPVRVDASLDRPLSRWLWLVKWLLAVPHYVVLAPLWIAFVVLSAVALVAIVITGRYPRPIFDFNVGVLRWSWRVAYYAYGALGTDQYPPFTLNEVPSYPAHLQIAYPEHLSRGLALVKWWLLAIPHYIVVAIFLGGGAWFASEAGRSGADWTPGLIGVLVLLAGVILAVTGRYPRGLFDLVLGLNRWVLRVAAYAGLMTDQYPPFRLDLGGADPSGTLELGPVQPGPPGSSTPRDPRPSGWTPGRALSVVAGLATSLLALGLLVGGAALGWAHTVQRDDGFVSSGTAALSSSGYAIATQGIDLRHTAVDGGTTIGWLGDVRVRATSTDADALFVGIARAADANEYLRGVDHTSLINLGDDRGRSSGGGAPAVPPQDVGIWTVQATGPGTQTIIWPARDGAWTVVVMNADASAPVTVEADIGATVPSLPWIASGVVLAALLALGVAAALIVIPMGRVAGSQQRGA